MLSGLSSLLFGNGGTDVAAADQTQAGQHVPLTTLDADMGWVLVDTAGSDSAPQPHSRPAQDADSPQLGHSPAGRGLVEEGEGGDGSQRKEKPSAVQHLGAGLARPLPVRVSQQQQRRQAALQQQKRRAALGKTLTRKHLDRGNKAFTMLSAGRRQASANQRSLRPCGSMNSRHGQRSSL